MHECLTYYAYAAAGSLRKRSLSRRGKTRAMGPESDTVYIGHLKTKKNFRNGSLGHLVYCIVSPAQTRDRPLTLGDHWGRPTRQDR